VQRDGFLQRHGGPVGVGGADGFLRTVRVGHDQFNHDAARRIFLEFAHDHDGVAFRQWIMRRQAFDLGHLALPVDVPGCNGRARRGVQLGQDQARARSKQVGPRQAGRRAPGLAPIQPDPMML
jgi:hypothetical protein